MISSGIENANHGANLDCRVELQEGWDTISRLFYCFDGLTIEESLSVVGRRQITKWAMSPGIHIQILRRTCHNCADVGMARDRPIDTY